MVIETLESLKVSHPEIDVTHFANNNPSQEKLVQHRVLKTFRDFIIWDYKAPLAKAIIALARRRNKRIGAITKENSVYRVTHMLLGMKEWFNQIYNNPGRNALLNAGWDIIICEVETNPAYRYIFQSIIFKIHGYIKAGDWPPQDPAIPPELAPGWKAELDV